MIKLRIPKKKNLPEFVNQGNFSANLQQGGTIETKSREFADWLIREHGLEEVKLPAKTKPKPPRPRKKQVSKPAEITKKTETTEGGKE